MTGSNGVCTTLLLALQPASELGSAPPLHPKIPRKPLGAVSGWSLLPVASRWDAEQLRKPSWAVPTPAEPIPRGI